MNKNDLMSSCEIFWGTKDDWIHFWSNFEYKGGWITVEAPLGKPPVFYRKESKFKDLFKSLVEISRECN